MEPKNSLEEFVSEQDLMEFVSFIGLERIAPGRFSTYLAAQLYAWTHYQPMSFMAGKVLAEIDTLEELGSKTDTVEEKRFQGRVLRGLWKTHHLYTGVATIALNVQAEMKRRDSEFREFFFGMKDLYPEKGTFEHQWHKSGEIARFVMSGYDKRRERRALTGEWLIFAKHENRNHYLALARHTDGDENIHREIISRCSGRWPWLIDLIGQEPRSE